MSGTMAKEDKLLEAALWWKELKERNNDCFLPLFLTDKRYLVLKGGGGSGKSIVAGDIVLQHSTNEPGHRWLVTRKVARTLRESCFAQLCGQLRQHYPDSGYKISRGDMSISFPNGSVILFAGLDDVEKLKSIYDITGIWCEEASEMLESDFNQLDIRLRTASPYPLQMILTFNPISITHWLKKRFFDRRDPRAIVHESSYKDNRFLSQEAVQTLESFRETDEYYYMVYCLGQWGVTGKTVFNAMLVAQRLEELRNLPKPRTGSFICELDTDGIRILSYRWEDAEEGPIRLYAAPGRGRPYVVGGDTAGDGSDWFVAQVLDNVTGQQVAVLRHRLDEDTYARQLYCLGKYYNDALLAVEVNFSTYPVKLLDLMGYTNQYVRQVEDQFDGRIRHAYGFRTDRLTRPVIISELIRILRSDLSTVFDEATLLEMLTFIRNEKLRPEAEAGAHDDCVMALAIAHYVRPQQTMEIKQSESRKRWTEDMWEDYNHAGPAERAQMVRLWGNPK